MGGVFIFFIIRFRGKGGLEVIVNGKMMDFDEGIAILDLLKKLNLSKEKVVVELNYNIIAKEQFTEILLNKEDKVEIVSFVGGG